MNDAWRDLLSRAWASPAVAVVGSAAGVAWAALAITLAAALKSRRRWRTGDTRKLFHFLVFGAAAAAQWRAGFAGVCAYGGGVSLVVLFAVVRGDGQPWFEALARESDAPRRTWYVVVPWLATALGGLLANVCFQQHALFGYLVVGFGDAVGEPVGIRFGRHRYRVPLPARVVSTRSVEGSAAVFVACAVAALVGLAAVHGRTGTFGTFELAGRIALFALGCTLVEAASPHGWDNLVLQLAGSGGALLLFTA